jgi:predicted MFS family arabinose efflux permease
VRLVLLVSALGLFLAVAGLSPGVYVLVAVVGFGGLFVSPALATVYVIADEIAAPGARTEAGAWVNTAYNAGDAAGTAGVGLLVGRLPLTACFVVAAAAVLLPAVPLVVSIGAPRRRGLMSGR